MKKFIAPILITLVTSGYQSTGSNRLILPPVSLETGEAFAWQNSIDSYLFADDKVIKQDLDGKKINFNNNQAF